VKPPPRASIRAEDGLRHNERRFRIGSRRALLGIRDVREPRLFEVRGQCEDFIAGMLEQLGVRERFAQEFGRRGRGQGFGFRVGIHDGFACHLHTRLLARDVGRDPVDEREERRTHVAVGNKWGDPDERAQIAQLRHDGIRTVRGGM
jgi:hypothetical protein